jgi:predicted nucleic acid-binding protein
VSRIFWDTNLFIYFFEQHPTYAKLIARLRTKMNQRGDDLVTSWMTVGEVQVQPRLAGNPSLGINLRNSITETARIVDFNKQASEHYVEIRATTKVKGPDAIQLACAASSGVELFVTNDAALQKVRVDGIHFIVSIETALQLLS